MLFLTVLLLMVLDELRISHYYCYCSAISTALSPIGGYQPKHTIVHKGEVSEESRRHRLVWCMIDVFELTNCPGYVRSGGVTLYTISNLQCRRTKKRGRHYNAFIPLSRSVCVCMYFYQEHFHGQKNKR